MAYITAAGHGTRMRPDFVGACSWLAVAMMVLATSGVTPTTSTVVSDSVLTDAVPTTASAETAPVTNSTAAATTTRSTAAALAAASDATTDVASSENPATTATAANTSASSESESTVTSGAAVVSMATSSGNAGYSVSEPTSADAAESSSATSTEAVTSNASAAVGATTQKVTANDSLTPEASTSTATSEALTTTAAATHSSSTTSGGVINVTSSRSTPTTSYSNAMQPTTKPTLSTGPAAVAPVDGAVVGGVVGGVVGIIVISVIVALAIHCRRRMVPTMRSIIPPMPPMPTPTPPELVKLSKQVNLADFPDYVKQMSADSCYGFAEEFEVDLKNVGRDQSTITASLAHNLGKNRFTNILPYDHSRVKLFTSGGPDKSDYINANYIPGHNDSKEFIATQGPMQSTTNDFWRMVWEQQCKAIVMLTRCTEGLVDKCHHYWPSGHDTVTYGGVTVQVTDELEQPYWTVTDFCISAAADAVGSGSGGDAAAAAAAAPPLLPEAAAAAPSLQLRQQQQRHVRHFHYTAFPDHRAPPDAESMLQFVRLVRSKLTRSPGGPVVVHCSAGVGRSGTYIAIDRILQQVEDGCTSVDLFGAVREMRMHRTYMVQTEEQYVFIHQIIEQELQLRRHSKDSSNGSTGIDNKAFAGE